MIKKIPTGRLKIGVFVEKIDQSWFSSPFLFSKFKITSLKQIQKFKEYNVKDVYINTDKGLDPATSSPATPEETPSPAPVVKYLEIPTDKLQFDTALTFDLFIKEEGGHSLYLRKGLPYHTEVQSFLENNRIKSVYIPESQKGLFEKYIKDTQKERELSDKGLAPGFESREKVEQYNDYLNNYIPVNHKVFFSGMRVPFALYKEKDTVVANILKAGGAVPESEHFSKGAKEEKRFNLLVHVDDNDAYKNFLKELASGELKGGFKDASIMRVEVVKENSKLVARELMNNPRSGEAVKEAKNVASEMIENILENPSSFYGLMKINTYDYYTYLHSINVCTLSIGLAMALGLSREELMDIAIGALMHDVGKSKVPSSLINKPGRLTDQEFVLVKKHVILGYDLLEGQDILSKNAMLPLLQHHEKMNGNGYPNRLEGDQVHLYGRISSIVDVYDALTTERAYKKAFRPFDAVSLLSRNPDEFDQDVFKQFVEMLGQQIMQGK